MQLEQHGSHGVGRSAIQVARGFVAKQKQRLADQRPRQSHALLLTSGKLCGPMVQTVFQANLCHQRPRALAVPIARFRNQRRDQNVLEHRTLRQQAMILKDKTNLFIAKRGQFFFGQFERTSAIERHAA